MRTLWLSLAHALMFIVAFPPFDLWPAALVAITPLIAIMAPLEINPQIIMWDPDTYPDVETIAWAGQLQWLLVLLGYWVDRNRSSTSRR